MREVDKHDLVLLGGLAIALVVMFQQPLTELARAGSELQERYGLALLPGLAILCIVFGLQHLIRLTANASKHKQRAETGRLVRMGEALTHAKSMDELRALLNHHLPQATGSEAVWAVLRVDGEWEALAGGLPKTPYRVSAQVETRADRFSQLDPERLDSVTGNEIDGDVCFGLPFGDHGVGVVGVPKRIHDPGAAARVLAPVSAVLGICARNVTLIAEIEAHGVMDGLTKCLNRTHGMTVLDAELQRAKRTRTDFTLVMLDLDDFKSVNDEYGHLCGDALLTAVGRRMHELLRNSDIKVRWGGEEFLIMLPDTPLAGAAHVANVLNRELGKLSVTWNEQSVTRTASVGVAAAKPGELDTADLLGRVDAALYRAKRGGRDQVCVDGGRTNTEHPTESAVVA